MLAPQSIALFLLKVLLASYFIFHGLSLSSSLQARYGLFLSRLNSFHSPITPPIYALEVYAHLEVVIGLTLGMGWRAARVLGLAALIAN